MRLNKEYLLITLKEPITKKTIFFAILLFSTMGVLLAESKWGQSKVREYYARTGVLEEQVVKYHGIKPGLEALRCDVDRLGWSDNRDNVSRALPQQILSRINTLEAEFREFGAGSREVERGPLNAGSWAISDPDGLVAVTLPGQSVVDALQEAREKVQSLVDVSTANEPGLRQTEENVVLENGLRRDAIGKLVLAVQAVDMYYGDILNRLDNNRVLASTFPRRLLSIQVTTACFLGGLCILFAVVAVIQTVRVVGARETAIQRLNIELEARVAAENGLSERTEQLERAVSIMEAALEQAAEATAEAKAAHEAKSEFFAKMSHELRTPLHGILSFARFGVAKHGSSPRDKLLAYFEKIERSGTILLGFLNDLLDLAKHDAHKMVYQIEPINMGSTVANVIDEFSSIVAEREVEINYVLPTFCTQVSADQSKIKQVIRNLLSNAIKHSPQGTSIDIDVTTDEDLVTTAVRDHGDGIPDEELDSVFERFVQSKKTKSGDGGTGLGLAICREIVTDHGGTVIANNHPAGGAVFSFQIPLAPADVEVETTVSGSVS